VTLGAVSAVTALASVEVGPARETPELEVDKDIYTSYTKYHDAVTAAKNAIDDPNSAQDPNNLYDTPELGGSAKITAIQAAYDSLNNTTDGDHDNYYETHTNLSGTALVKPKRREWVGDHYDVHGYEGMQTGITDHPDGVPTIQIVWSYDSGSPGPGE